MSHVDQELTPDLQAIGAQLTAAVRRDHHRRRRRRSRVRASVILIATSVALGGSALAGAQLTGTIDLGGGHTAVKLESVPWPTDPRLPYRYRVTGVHKHDGSANGTIYIESSQPLDKLTQAEIVAARVACGAQTTTADGATVWVFEAGCIAAR
jgi:hypothetical protein